MVFMSYQVQVFQYPDITDDSPSSMLTFRYRGKQNKQYEPYPRLDHVLSAMHGDRVFKFKQVTGE